MNSFSRLKIIFVFLAFSGFLQAQNVEKKNPAGTSDFSKPEFFQEPDSASPVTLPIRLAFLRALYEIENPGPSENRTMNFRPDPWLMSAVGADLDPFIRRPQFIGLHNSADWKVDLSIFAYKSDFLAIDKQLLYMADVRAVYQDHFLLESRWGYDVDREYFNVNYLGYIQEPFTFYLQQSFTWMVPGALPRSASGTVPNTIKRTGLGVEVKLNENFRLDAFQPLGNGGSRPFVGIRFSK